MDELNALQFERLVNSIERMIEARSSFRRDLAIEQAGEFSLEAYEEWFVAFPDGQELPKFIVDTSQSASCESCFRWTPERCVRCDVPVCLECRTLHICEGG